MAVPLRDPSRHRTAELVFLNRLMTRLGFSDLPLQRLKLAQLRFRAGERTLSPVTGNDVGLSVA